LLFATIATQASIVVLAPIVVDVGRDFGASLGEVGVARSVLAASAVAISLAAGVLIDRVGVRPLIIAGSLLAIAGAGLTAAAPSLLAFYAAHAVTGAAVACMLSAGFAGVAAFFPTERMPWAMGWVVGSQSVAWIAGNPIVGLLSDHGSWRLSYAVPATIAGLTLVAGLTAPDLRPAPGLRAERQGLLAVLRDPSARKWTLAELVAYSAWTAEITYAGAFYIQTYDLGAAITGVLLSVGSLVFLVASTNTARLSERWPRRPMIALAALAMGALLVPLLNLTPSVWFTVALFCVVAMCAAVRSTGTSNLGLSQLPAQPGTMMGARTASAQLGYVFGAGAGGVVLGVGGFGALGFVLFGVMAVSAVLILRVEDPEPAPAGGRYPEPVPD